MAADPKKFEAALEWPVPKDLNALGGFLGLTGYYCWFVRGDGVIAKPIIDLMKKDAFILNP